MGSMSSPRKLAALGTLLVLILAALGGVAWMLRSPGAPTVDPEQQERDKRAALRIVKLKDSSLAELENRDFHVPSRCCWTWRHWGSISPSVPETC